VVCLAASSKKCSTDSRKESSSTSSTSGEVLLGDAQLATADARERCPTCAAAGNKFIARRSDAIVLIMPGSLHEFLLDFLLEFFVSCSLLDRCCSASWPVAHSAVVLPGRASYKYKESGAIQSLFNS
jgi:hypothetical protein